MNYQDPYSLHYFLSAQKNQEVEKQVIKKVVLDFNSNSFELAIIGSSHFLHLQGCFFELLTCAPPPFINYFIHTKPLDVAFSSVNHQFEGFHYTFHLFFEKHEKESAITSIKLLEKQSYRLRLLTWHTYPESQVVIKTLTNLKI